MTNTPNIYHHEDFIIYKHTNTVSGKSYIGKTTQGLKKRWRQHISEATNKHNRNHKTHFHKAIAKYGEKCWRHEVLFISLTKDSDLLYDIEAKMIERFDTINHGYNSCEGGRGAGSGENHPWFGRKHSLETKLKLSNALAGKVMSDQTKAKISGFQRGRKKSTITKMKMSISQQGIAHYHFKGYYLTPYGRFITADTATSHNISKNTIYKWCKESDKTITRQAISHSNYLKSLNESPLGKTFRDLGFGFEPT